MDDDADARVCSTPDPDRSVKTFTVGYRGAKGEECANVLRVRASDGKVLDRITLPPSAKQVAGVQVHKGVTYVVTGDGVVSKVKDGALVEHAKLGGTPGYMVRTPQDPSLVISATRVKDGADWTITGHRLPSFELAWSTTGSKVFSKIDKRNFVDVWSGNGLWVSTTFGDTSDPESKVSEALVQLDPDTGEVASSTGAVKRDFRTDDPKVFSLTFSSPYDSVGFKNGDIVVPQSSGVMRYSLADKKVRWAVDTQSIMDSMERDRLASSVTQHYELIDGGKTVLVAMSNDISVELMTLKASSGKITGRWNVPVKNRNGLQTSPDVTPFKGGVALTHSDYSWDYAFGQSGREVPAGPRYDVGLFKLTKPKK